MTQYINFIINHWFLSALFLILLVALIVSEWINRGASGARLSPEAVVSLMNHQNALVFDFRSEAAFSQGHILGAQHFSMQALEKKIESLHKHKDKPIIFVNAENDANAKAQALLQQKGFQVFMLAGGMSAWKNAGLPLAKKD